MFLKQTKGAKKIMNIPSSNVSFKAKFIAPDASDVVKSVFELRTKNDTKHKIVLSTPSEYAPELRTFDLYTNDQKTASYTTEVISDGLISVQRLMGIYNLLKIQEAENKIKEIKSKK